MSRRLLILREIGLGPVWQSRHAPAPAVLPRDAMPPATMASAVADVPLPATAPVVALTPPAPVSPPLAAVSDWATLQQQVATCERCSLCRTRTQPVFGKGNPRARIMLVGEAPGAEEDRQGLPFVGKAGQLLDNMLAAIGLSGEEVYVANVLKCRPPGNRNPQADEVAACEAYLHAQIQHVQPQVIVTLGRFAAHALLQSTAAIGALRREVHAYQGVPLFATFHPAYLLRSPGEKAKAWQDLLAIRKALAAAGMRAGITS